MNIYRITLNIKSPLGTPLYNDTIFGHICWGIVNNEGEDKLYEFFKEYDNGNPPLIISNPFPEGMLPMPKLETTFPSPESDIEEIKKLKKLKKKKYISSNIFIDNKPINVNAIKDDINKENEDKIYTIIRNKNIINRKVGSTLENGLYSINEYWYGKKDIKKGHFSNLEMYVYSIYDEERILKLLEWAFQFGYGADSSIGYGKIEITKDNIEKIKKEDLFNEGNRAMALGNFVIDEKEKDNISDLRSDVFTRFGKIGGDLVYQINPFKKPIVMFTEGSTFINKSDKLYIGSLLKNVHKDDRIRHYAYAPLIYYNEGVANEK